MINTGEKWTRKFRKAAGQNTVRIVGKDPHHLCMQYIRHGGQLELMPQGSFLRQFKKIEYKAVDLSMDDLGHKRSCDLFKAPFIRKADEFGERSKISIIRSCDCKGEKTKT